MAKLMVMVSMIIRVEPSIKAIGNMTSNTDMASKYVSPVVYINCRD